MTDTPGTRVYAAPNATLLVFDAPGQFGQTIDGVWWLRVPVDGFPMVGVSALLVTAHTDGTISLAQPLLVAARGGVCWRGYLIRGIWKET